MRHVLGSFRQHNMVVGFGRSVHGLAGTDRQCADRDDNGEYGLQHFASPDAHIDSHVVPACGFDPAYIRRVKFGTGTFQHRQGVGLSRRPHGIPSAFPLREHYHRLFSRDRKMTSVRRIRDIQPQYGNDLNGSRNGTRAVVNLATAICHLTYFARRACTRPQFLRTSDVQRSSRAQHDRAQSVPACTLTAPTRADCYAPSSGLFHREHAAGWPTVTAHIRGET
jgi:hypothetical protein